MRDPLGSVTRDGVHVEGSEVFINYSNEVLLENDGPPLLSTLLQAGRPVGTPASLKCLHWMVCLTDAESASLSEVETGARIVSMSSQVVEYRDGSGRSVVVKLR